MKERVKIANGMKMKAIGEVRASKTTAAEAVAKTLKGKTLTTEAKKTAKTVEVASA